MEGRKCGINTLASNREILNTVTGPHRGASIETLDSMERTGRQMNTNGGATNPSFDSRTCHYCGEVGHIKPNCPKAFGSRGRSKTPPPIQCYNNSNNFNQSQTRGPSPYQEFKKPHPRNDNYQKGN